MHCIHSNKWCYMLEPNIKWPLLPNSYILPHHQSYLTTLFLKGRRKNKYVYVMVVLFIHPYLDPFLIHETFYIWSILTCGVFICCRFMYAILIIGVASNTVSKSCTFITLKYLSHGLYIYFLIYRKIPWNPHARNFKLNSCYKILLIYIH